MPASAQNARSTAMPPPSKDATRRTLAERAGEIPRSASTAPGSRAYSGAVKPTSLANAGRQPSLSSSTSSMRPPSVNSQRNISNGSFSSSVSSNSRPPSAQSFRPQTAMGNPRIQKPPINQFRPSTAMETYNTGPGAGFSRKRKGKPQFSLDPRGAPQMPAQMQRNVSHDTGMNYKSGWLGVPYRATSLRDVSISTAMSGLSLNDATPKPTVVQSLEVPLTPSQIPRLAPSLLAQSEASSPSKSTSKTPSKSPKKRASPQRFLTRDSNTLAAYETDNQLEQMDNMYSKLMETISGATTESNGLKEMVDVYKARSRLSSPIFAIQY